MNASGVTTLGSSGYASYADRHYLVAGALGNFQYPHGNCADEDISAITIDLVIAGVPPENQEEPYAMTVSAFIAPDPQQVELTGGGAAFRIAVTFVALFTDTEEETAAALASGLHEGILTINFGQDIHQTTTGKNFAVSVEGTHTTHGSSVEFHASMTGAWESIFSSC